VSPLLITGSPATVWFAGGVVDERRGVTRHFREGEVPPEKPSKAFDTSFITGAAPMMRMGTWSALGGFREDLFLYWEDADLCRRAVASGLSLQVVPDARVWHAQGGSSADSPRGNGPAFYYFNQRNRLLVCGPRAGAAKVAAVTGLRETVRLLVKPLLLERSGRGQKVAASVRGIRDGLAGRTGRGSFRHS
jgi:GT2 family glycosyltransferase